MEKQLQDLESRLNILALKVGEVSEAFKEKQMIFTGALAW